MCADFDSNYQIWIDNFKKSKFLLFPHAITLRGTEYNEFRNISKDYKDLDNNIRIESLKKFPVGTVFYSCNDDELYFFKKFVGSNIILKNIGFVRLSKEWINFRKKKFKNIKQNILKKKNLLLLVGKVSYIGQNELDKKINDIIRIAEKINHNIIIKNHPRNNFNIKRYSLLGKNVKIFESNESLHAILPKVEFVIMTSKSGVCMDCIAYGKIPIEFYKYNRNNLKNNFYEFRFNSNITSIYKFKNLTFSFDNFIKLSTFVDLITKNNFLKNQYFRKIKESYKKIVEQNQDCLKNFTEIFN